MIITREQWNQIADRSSAPIVQDVLDSLSRGIKVTVKDAGHSPYMEFTRREQFEAEYRKKLRSKRDE